MQTVSRSLTESRRANCSLSIKAVVTLQPVPRRIGSVQQGPVLAIGRIVDHPEQIRWPALHLHGDLPGRQHPLHQRLVRQPSAELIRLGRGLRVEVQLGSEALFQPMIEGVAKARGHAARADIRGQGQ